MKRILVRLFWRFSVVETFAGKWRILVKRPFYDPAFLTGIYLTRKRAEARAQELRKDGGFLYYWFPSKH